METEKVTLDLPKPLIEWYIKIADSEGRSLEETLEREMAAHLATIMENQEHMGKINLPPLIRESGILDVFSKHHGRCMPIDWLEGC